MHTHTHTNTHTHTHTHTHTYTQTNTHIHIQHNTPHTHTHKHIHTCLVSQQSSVHTTVHPFVVFISTARNVLFVCQRSHLTANSTKQYMRQTSNKIQESNTHYTPSGCCGDCLPRISQSHCLPSEEGKKRITTDIYKHAHTYAHKHQPKKTMLFHAPCYTVI